jgi:long-chain fatty acid transport protein
MVKQFKLKKLVLFLSISSVIVQTYAAGFQRWGLDAASIGNDHAERAAITEDASASYYNPAGLVNIKNQQFVGGVGPTLTDIRFHGTEAVNTLPNSSPQAVAVQGGTFRLFPYGHYAAPITNRIIFGLSVVEPFGFHTNYRNTTSLRYTAIQDSLDVVDISPSLGVALTDKLSVGVAMDFERMNGQFYYATTAIGQTTDTTSYNSGNDWSYGYRLGILYQFTPKTRVGIAYQSQSSHQISGNSQYSGPLAVPNGVQNSVLKMNVMLPPTTTVSFFHSPNDRWDFMGSVSLTQWTVTNTITMNNVGGTSGGGYVNTLRVPLIQGYGNAWNYAVGTNYHVNDKVMLRAGVGYDQTPSNNNYRNVQLPDSNQVNMAIGSHIQATPTIGFDVGWTHSFMTNTRVNNVSQVTGDQIATTNGSVRQSMDVYGLQVKWDIL